MEVDFEAGSVRQVIDPELLRPSHHRTAWTKCYVIKKDKTFMMFTEATSRFLLAACLVGDEFRISNNDSFLSVHDTACNNSGQRHVNGRYVCVVRRTPNQPGFALFSLGCENCDNRLGKYSCEPLMSPLHMETIGMGTAAASARGALTGALTPTPGRASATAGGTPKAVAAAVSSAVSAAAAPLLSALRGHDDAEDAEGGGRGWSRSAHRRGGSGGAAIAMEELEGGAAREGSSSSLHVRSGALRSISVGGADNTGSSGALSPYVAPDPVRQKLAEITQRVVHLERAGVDIRCLTVLLPRVFDDLSRVVWCPRNKRGTGGGFSPRVLLLNAYPGAAPAGGSSGSPSGSSHNLRPSGTTPVASASGAPLARTWSMGSATEVPPAAQPHASYPGSPTKAAPPVVPASGPPPLSALPAHGLPPTGPRGHHRTASAGHPMGIAAVGRDRVHSASSSTLAALVDGITGTEPETASVHPASSGTHMPSARSPVAQTRALPGPPHFEALPRAHSDGGVAWMHAHAGVIHGTSPSAGAQSFLQHDGSAAPGHVLTRTGPSSQDGLFARPVTPSSLPAGVPSGLNGALTTTTPSRSPPLQLPPNAALAPRPRTGSETYTAAPSISMESHALPPGAPAPPTPVPSSPHAMATAQSPSLVTVRSSFGFVPAPAPAPAAPRAPLSIGAAATASLAVELPPPPPTRRASSTASMSAAMRRNADGTYADTMVFENRMPEWNEGLGSLTMKFLGGRIGDSSSKNYLMEMLPPPDADGIADSVSAVSSHSASSTTPGPKRTPCLQFGKIKNGRFSCDFRYPYSPVQAFGVFLSAFYWTLKQASPPGAK